MNYSDCPNWSRWLAEFKDKPCHALEIGSYLGESAVWFAENILTHPESTLLCLDAWVAIEPYKSRGTNMQEVFETFKINVRFHEKIDFWRCTIAAEVALCWIVWDEMAVFIDHWRDHLRRLPLDLPGRTVRAKDCD